MKENWIQLIDTIEKDPFETEAFFALMDYVGEASDDDKRRVVQEVERRIKMIARYDADKSFRFRKFSEQEREVLDSLWSTRVKILNVMMLNPTEEEIERLGHQNDKLRELSKDAFAQGRNLWKSLLHSPSLMANEDYYDVEEHVDFSWNDEDSVLKMDNDDYYGSDFEYMLHFHCNFRDSGRYYVGEPLVADDGTSLRHACDAYGKRDGDSGRQAFRNGTNGQRHGGNEHVEGRFATQQSDGNRQ